MNGQMYQTCAIVTAAKIALKNGGEIDYAPLNYEDETKFLFQDGSVARSVSEWFERIRKLGLDDMKFLSPTSVPDRSLLGFSNTTASGIACFFADGAASYFTPHWEFTRQSSQDGKWLITYTENKWENPPEQKPKFDDNRVEFASILTRIKALAQEIECEHFADIFQKALNALNDDDTVAAEYIDKNILALPRPNLGLFLAADISDVFGAMGSWNDSPPYMAQQKGLGKEYDELSDELLRQNRLALLYAINEW
ncbi:hypothetical protein [Campylobacter curvus]|uniref:hypothetical protein n=1 Tax=Campylobacter curvus TaxID=200 RepID=UPI00036B30A4|nr:hypothetical protein [Campylobacter curvus]QKF60418.1 hypothetical protein CCVT_0090 [Campylobacter curvus]UEB50563.1 RNA polymerase subunit sigma [Campylobacter curvus]